MRTCVFKSAFFLSAAILLGLSNAGYAQQTGVVGVSLTLRPIQTIQVNVHRQSTEITSSRSQAGSPIKSPFVTDFGTTRYGVSVDRITTDSLAILKRAVTGQKSHPSRSETAPRVGEHPLRIDRDRTLVVYSIRVN